MMIVSWVKFIGLLSIALIYGLLFYRYRRWWVLLFTLLGCIAAVVQIIPMWEAYHNWIAGIYIVMVLVLSSALRSMSHSKLP